MDPVADNAEFLSLLFTVLGTIVGAGIVALVTWINGLRETRKDVQLALNARGEHRRVAMTERVSDYLAAAHHGVASLRDVALAPAELKNDLEKRETWPTVDRVNRALVAIQVNDDADLVVAVQRVDQAMIQLASLAMTKTFLEDEWRSVRRMAMNGLTEAVVATARSHAKKLVDGGEASLDRNKPSTSTD